MKKNKKGSIFMKHRVYRFFSFPFLPPSVFSFLPCPLHPEKIQLKLRNVIYIVLCFELATE